MGFFDKLKGFANHISEVENNIYTNKQDFLEVYERNVQLEKEIAERTNELDAANQKMLTLHHIWEMMNSSKPLSSVLETIVKTLQGEMGYLHSCIIQKKEEDGKQYLKIISQTESELLSRVNSALGAPVQSMNLAYDEKGVFAQALCGKTLIQTVDLRFVLSSMLPNLPADTAQKILNNAKSSSVLLVPLCTMNVEFGWLVMFSTREEATEGELDFLNLFARQIELAITIADLFQAVKNQAVTDPLTTLYNRRYFEEFIEKEAIRALRMNQPFTVIGLDLDFLKQINDKYGHLCGDLAIKTVADVLKINARSIDVAARMGGEEFNVLLPGIDSAGGLIAAERIRAAIADCNIDQVGQITASIGVGTFLEHSNKIDELLEITDQAMYLAKRNGRNQVQLAKPITETSWLEVAMNTFMDILSKKRIPVSKEVADDLYQKLSGATDDKTVPKAMIYNVADMLAKTYNPLHSQGVTRLKVILTTNIAKSFDLSKEEIDKLRIATLLYDIGNLMIPQELLQKTEPLSDEERAQIKTHPVIAARDILKPISDIQDIIPIIEHHHENWDGSGYPGNVSGEAIPLSSQIILITDAYFALIEPRAYRNALTPLEALDVINKDANKKWNPELVKHFMAIVENELK
jgi:diguanylate cyclase (GGDEF)-like protein